MSSGHQRALEASLPLAPPLNHPVREISLPHLPAQAITHIVSSLSVRLPLSCKLPLMYTSFSAVDSVKLLRLAVYTRPHWDQFCSALLVVTATASSLLAARASQGIHPLCPKLRPVANPLIHCRHLGPQRAWQGLPPGPVVVRGWPMGCHHRL